MEMKNKCLKCNVHPNLEAIAYICSYECTFCEDCTKLFANICPNCKGELIRRPKSMKK